MLSVHVYVCVCMIVCVCVHACMGSANLCSVLSCLNPLKQYENRYLQVCRSMTCNRHVLMDWGRVGS